MVSLNSPANRDLAASIKNEKDVEEFTLARKVLNCSKGTNKGVNPPVGNKSVLLWLRRVVIILVATLREQLLEMGINPSIHI